MRPNAGRLAFAVSVGRATHLAISLLVSAATACVVGVRGKYATEQGRSRVLVSCRANCHGHDRLNQSAVGALLVHPQVSLPPSVADELRES